MITRILDISFAISFVMLISCRHQFTDSIPAEYDLKSDSLAQRWDDAVPLGNGSIGSLVWKKENHLRFSIDRGDLWDLRPVKEFSHPEFSHLWVYKKVMEGDYDPVQKLFDQPYVREPGPTKIPGGAIEFDIADQGVVEKVQLHLNNALCEIKWKNGLKLKTFIHATEPVGWFRFENTGEKNILPLLITPDYSKDSLSSAVKDNLYPWQDLRRLGYKKGKVEELAGSQVVYHQQIWGGMSYDIVVKWNKKGNNITEGVWNITTNYPDKDDEKKALEIVEAAFLKGYDSFLESHIEWWNDFWSKSSVHIPDKQIERQWYRDIYKFGATSRQGAPPVSLQAVWTADNGLLPPWKGDFHNDMNTQMSYWAGYSSNHLSESKSFTDWLIRIMPECRKWTRTYFGVNGMNVPGVATVTGEPLGGWIQYAFSYTTAGWLAQHFYLQWKYSMDRNFLEKEAYPYFKEVATFFKEITTKQSDGTRKLPLSSSAEIHNNSIHAWFFNFTCIDLALIRFTFEKASELANDLELTNEAEEWKDLLSEFPDLPVNEKGELLLAMNTPLMEPHRHHSHLISIYPLGMLSIEKGEADRKIILSSLEHLDKLGHSELSGWPSAWYANLLARAGKGEEAARVLNYFTRAFVSGNSFHTNSDQLKTKNRIFTLEGNFGFASAVQEMLLQSQNKLIRIFPAVPADWKDIDFKTLRAEGAFLVSAVKKAGKVNEVKILAEKGGKLQMVNPFGSDQLKIRKNSRSVLTSPSEGIFKFDTSPGDIIEFKN